MSSTEIGRHAETIVGDNLSRLGYIIIERNWRTRWCEVDLIAKKDDVIYIIEVKYRRRTNLGDGLDAINQLKLAKLKKAALIWASANSYNGDYSILIVSVSGDDYRIDSCLELD